MLKGDFLKRLSNTQLANYSYEKTIDSFNKSDRITITCKIHGDFKQVAQNHLLGSECGACWREKLKSGSVRRKSNLTFINDSKRKFGNSFSYEKTNYVGLDNAVIITCAVHGEISITPRQHLTYPFGCLLCGNERRYNERLTNAISAAKKIHGDKYDYSKMSYKNFEEKVEIVCSKHGSFWQNFQTHVSSECGCPSCAADNNKTSLEQFITRAVKIHGYKYSYKKVKYNTLQDSVIIGCNIHGDFNQRANSHLSGCGCSKCCFENFRLDSKDFIDKAKKIHGDRYDYSKVVYVNNKSKVEIVCSKHGSFWQKPNAHVSSTAGCPKCIESKGESAVRRILEHFGIVFIQEYKIPNYPYRFDFYLPEQNIFIEFNGQQHYNPIDFFGGDKEHALVKMRDEIKRRLVYKHKGNLITISFKRFDTSLILYVIKRLRQIYLYWFKVSGKILTLRTISDVYSHFKIDDRVLTIDLISLVLIRNKDVEHLF